MKVKIFIKKSTLFLILVLFLFSGRVRPQKISFKYFRGKKNILRVVFLDVGQGDACLITTPSGKNILVDGGLGRSRFSAYDAGYRVVVPYLHKRNIKRIDIMIASHPHADHIGGLIAVLKSMPVGKVYDVAINYPSPVYESFLKTIDVKKVEYHKIRAGDKLFFDTYVKISVFGPQRVYKKVNNNSVTFKLTYKSISFLFTGDIENQAERDIVFKYGSKIKSFVIKVPHHGSRTSINPEFLNAVDPKYAVISVGRNNRYGLPNQKALNAYMDRNVIVYRTDYQGNVEFKTDGIHYAVKTYKLHSRY